jgi:hypothetical protein
MGLCLVIACAASDEKPAPAEDRTWRCYTNPTAEGVYCECRFASDAELESEGLNPASFAEDSCPPSNYKCCETYSRAEAYDGIESCICWNPETVPFCNGKAPMVLRCPQ